MSMENWRSAEGRFSDTLLDILSDLKQGYVPWRACTVSRYGDNLLETISFTVFFTGAIKGVTLKDTRFTRL